MTRNEIIAKTLTKIRPHFEQHKAPYSEELDCQTTVIAALQVRLPETDIKTCEDFRHLRVTCCDTCHQFYPHYEMSLVDLLDVSKGWVCDPVFQNISVRDDHGKVRTTSVIGGKIFP